MNIYKFIFLNFILFVVFVYLNFFIQQYYHTSTTSTISLTEIINKNNFNLRGLLLGSVFGFVFGFVDNFFLVMGIDNIVKYFHGNTITKAGIGNTYSNIVACFIGVFISDIMVTMTESRGEEFPLWASSIGMLIGCLSGLYFGKLIIKPYK